MNETNNVIEKTNVIVDDRVDETTVSNMDLQITLTNGETLQFTAESQFFTPRRIQTNSPEILNIVEEFLVERTPNDVPVVKLPIGARDITTPQYYANSIVRDVYQTNDINNFFTELTDDLVIPAEPRILQTLRNQRDASLLAASALEDLISGVEAGDPDLVIDANQDIEDGLEQALNFEPNIDELLTPEEENELAALDLVGLSEFDVDPEIADDIIDPLPLISEDNVATAIPYLQSKLDGVETVNKAIELLNTGLEKIEGAVDRGDGQCQKIPVAKGKRRFGIGKRKTISVDRDAVVERRNFARSELDKQRSSQTPLPDYYKSPRYILTTIYGNVPVAGVGSLGGIATSKKLSDAVQNVVLLSFLKKFNADKKVKVSKKFTPMSRDQIIDILQTIIDELEKTLDKPC